MSLLKELENKKLTADVSKSGKERTNVTSIHSGRDPYSELKSTLHKKIVDELKKMAASDKDNKEVLIKQIEHIVDKLIEDSSLHIPRWDKAKIASELVDEIVFFGPITPLLNDAEITEVMVNGPNQVYIEKGGKLYLSEAFFRDDEHVMHIIERIIAPIGRRIDESMPMVDARLPDGSRVNAIIPPLSLTGPTITIRKFSKDPFMMEDLINFGTLTSEMARFIEACINGRLNIVISGGTDSGKTTTLNVLSSFIPSTERIVTVEDAAELQLRQPHVVRLESRPPNIEGRGEITIRDLVRNCLRMRPDRIIVGEVRSGEALDMLQAMNTGHDGSLTTGHANTPRDMLARLETMVLMAGMDLPIRAIREQVSSAINLIVHQNRFRDGTRRITHITEVQGMEGNVITLQDIFVFRQTGIDKDGKVMGNFEATGIRPKFIDKLIAGGISLPSEIFEPSLF
ncbi:MAG: CpaF family protein [Tepidanaerobacteraceae bacterium]|nr:CpaF family protein [Tepidanaerobacteraceae bacterium]